MSESEGRVILVEKSRSTSTGRCTITNGVAGIRDDPKKYITRRWFTVGYDELTPSQANNYLTNGRGSPHYERTIYLIISLKDDQRPRFTGSDDELSEVMRAATVEAMRVLAEGVEASRLVWVARTHPDYPHPCVKVLIRRDIGLDWSKALEAFPRRLRSPCSDAFLRVFEEAVSRKKTMLDFQIPELRPGSYRVRVESATLTRAPTREPMIEYIFRVLDSDQQEQHARSQQIITTETYERVMNNLNVCGINCPAGDIARYLPRARGVELDITISSHAAHAVTFNRRLDNRSLSERGISEEMETLPDYGAMLGTDPLIEIHGVEDWECGDSLLLELDPNFQVIEGEQ